MRMLNVHSYLVAMQLLHILWCHGSMLENNWKYMQCHIHSLIELPFDEQE